MEEADYLCDRIAIIDDGKIIALDTPQNLKRMVGADVVSIETDGREGLTNLLRSFKWVEWLNERDGVIDIGVKNGHTRVPEIVLAAHRVGIEVKSISIREPDLEAVFLKFTGRKIREEEGDSRQQMRRMVRTFRMRR
jgi:ABC-2 type transport system ATP-binding protein